MKLTPLVGIQVLIVTTLVCSPLYAFSKPNVLLILPDQMRATAMGCMGNRDVQTPHIDRMASEGIRSQMKNLVEDATSLTLRNSLDDKLSERMKSNGDSWSFNSNELLEEGGRLYKHETFYTIEEYRQWLQHNPEKAER